MASRAQRKFKHAKRVHHQQTSRTKKITTFIREELAVDLAPYQERMIEQMGAAGMFDAPSRAKCPACGFSHKVRKNGTMSRHDVYVGESPQECQGTGAHWSGSRNSPSL